MRRPAVLLATLACAGAMIVGCSDTPTSSGDEPESESPDASSSSTEDILVPEGVELTPEGSELPVGETATVAYEPRQGQVGVLDIRVTRLEKTSFKESFVGWDLDAEDRKKAPYFVRATITNRGTIDLGGRPVPLYILDGNNTLVEATSFGSTFKACTPGSFPEKFGPEKKVQVCLVYLAPEKGGLTAASFRPAEDYDPITWTGELETPKPPKGDGKNKPDKGKPGQGDKGKPNKGDGGDADQG